jgi:hypothetical protein
VNRIRITEITKSFKGARLRGVSGLFLVNFVLPSLRCSASGPFERKKEQGKRRKEMDPGEISVP